MLAAEAGHPLDMTWLDPEAWMPAMVRSFYLHGEDLADQISSLIFDV